MDSDTLIASKNQEIAELKSALMGTEKRLSKANEAATEAKNAILKEFQERFSAKIEENEEELQQLRKSNADLMARIEALLNEVGSLPCAKNKDRISHTNLSNLRNFRIQQML